MSSRQQLLVENRLFRNSKYLLDTLSPTSQYVGSIIKTFNIYTTIPRAQLKYRLKELIQCVSQTGTKNKSITILISLALSKAIQNLIRNINRT